MFSANELKVIEKYNNIQNKNKIKSCANNSKNSNDDDDMDIHEYRKFLKKIFPSKYLDNKIKNGENIINKSQLKNKKKHCLIEKSSSNDSESIKSESSESSSESESDEYETDYSSDDELTKEPKINISLKVHPNKQSNKKNSVEYDIEYDIEYDSENSDDDEWTDTTSNSTSISSSSSSNSNSTNNDNENNTYNNNNTTEETLTYLKECYTKNANDKILKKCIDTYEDEIKIQQKLQLKNDKKQKKKNLIEFKNHTREKSVINDVKYFNNLSKEEQLIVNNEFQKINKEILFNKPHRFALLDSDMPIEYKAHAIKKINLLKHMDSTNGEYYKIKDWVDKFMRVPFGKYSSLPITIDDGIDKCHDFMQNAQEILDNAVYGLNDAKLQIMQLLGQLITNPIAIGSAIAIHGPPGTGKTSLVKEGISKILNRPFEFIALGGATDSSFLEGHSYTYEGSTIGKIIQTLISSKCMNPIIYFDELDKISDTPKGEEIVGILTHLIDSSQNSQFNDKYFSEINFDLSKCLFIFSYNNESKINPILKDRMYRIETKGYNKLQKTVIGNKYLLPKIQEQLKFNNDEIIIPDESIQYIIENFCDNEDGVRNLKRCIETIHTKLNLFRLLKDKSHTIMCETDLKCLKVEFPIVITKDIINVLIKNAKNNFSALYAMYV